MNRPQEYVNQLLSGYLDDALTADERAEVDGWLRDVPSIAAQYDDLRSIRQTLRSIGMINPKRSLPSDFSRRVLEMSVARARAEGVADDHPLIRVSEQPTSLNEPAAPTSWSKIASVVAAIAASVAVASVLLQPSPASVANRIAEPTNQVPNRNVAEPPMSRPNGLADSTVDDAAEKTLSQPVPVASASRTDVASRTPTVDDPARSNASVMPDKVSGTQIEPSIPDPMASKSIASDSIAVSPIAASPIVSDPIVSDSNLNRSVTQLDVVLVIDVRLTDLGRATGAVRKAMRSSSILQTDSSAVDAGTASVTLVAAGQQENDPVSIFFLRAPAKRLDQFYLTLLSDDAGVVSVGMTVATNISIPGTVEKTDVDPVDVQHDGLLQVSDPAMGMQQLGSRLGGLSYLPFDPAMAGAIKPESGVDFPTQVLVLVR